MQQIDTHWQGEAEGGIEGPGEGDVVVDDGEFSKAVDREVEDQYLDEGHQLEA